jgi:hypothetical protein
MGGAGFESFDHGQQMADRAGKPMQSDHDHGFPRTDLTQQPGQHRAAAVGAGDMLLQHRPTDYGPQLTKLRSVSWFSVET